MTGLFSNITRIDFSDHNGLSKRNNKTPRILLLQGPVGPFFKLLQSHLNQNGFDAWRVCFNAGDLFFSNKDRRILYSQGPDNFEAWFERLLVDGEFDLVVYLGSERNIHLLAKSVADSIQVPTISLEEGYFRPGYITCEEGGNNRLSPIARQLPPSDHVTMPRATPAPATKAFNRMIWLGFLYFVMRGLFTANHSRRTFHKRRPLLPEAFFWLRNYTRWLFNQSSNYRLTERLLEKSDKHYYLLPLQVADDNQLIKAGRSWNNDKYLEAAISSFAKHAPANTELLVKIHPISRGHSRDREMTAALAKLFGAEGRVHVLDTGSLGLLCRHAKGMLTINSTSGLSAIAHGTPIFVIGDAIYRHPALAWCANDIEELDRFWSEGKAASIELRRKYLSWLAQEAVLPGDYYAKDGVQVAIRSVEKRLSQMCQKSKHAVGVDQVKVFPAAE